MYNNLSIYIYNNAIHNPGTYWDPVLTTGYNDSGISVKTRVKGFDENLKVISIMLRIWATKKKN